jgi:uncharacterized protein YaaR (DUF327 family)
MPQAVVIAVIQAVLPAIIQAVSQAAADNKSAADKYDASEKKASDIQDYLDNVNKPENREQIKALAERLGYSYEFTGDIDTKEELAAYGDFLKELANAAMAAGLHDVAQDLHRIADNHRYMAREMERIGFDQSGGEKDMKLELTDKDGNVTTLSPTGPLPTPGGYVVTTTSAGGEVGQPVEVENWDPRISVTP